MRSVTLPPTLSPPSRSAPWAALMACLGLLAACAQKPAAPPAAAAPGASAAQTAASDPARTAPAPAPAPVVAEPPAPPNPAVAQRLIISAIELLESGSEDQASQELQRALQADPGSRLAQSLMRQITADPQVLLGREYFPYRVQPGESLSKIAGRFMGDVHLFYILARYNDIKVPKQLAGGQTIKVPGKAPPAGAAAPGPAPAPPATAKPAPLAASAASAPASKPAVAVNPNEAADKLKQDIARLTRAARSAFARQDLNGAIGNWDKVLALDPGNATAQLERQKALDLKEKLKGVK